MDVRDFGQFEGPLILFGGPYSNLAALQELARIIGEKPAICTGDIVAYGAKPAETIELFLSMNIRAVAGNCEKQLVEDESNCGCGFGQGSACDLLSAGWWAHTVSQVGPNLRAKLAELPDIGILQHENRRYGVIHGGGTAVNRFIWPNSAQSDFETEIAAVEAKTGKLDGIIAGHAGIAFQRRVGDHHWINAGAIGLPPHDGRPETRYAVLDGGEVVIHRLAYDHNAAREAMEVAGLTQGYHETMTTGIWPSEDILPVELRRFHAKG